MQVLYERCAAVDVGKDVIAVAVRLPGDGPDGRAAHKRTFKTFYGVLREAARWLSSVSYPWFEAPVHEDLEITQVYGYLICPSTGRVLIQDDHGVFDLPGGTPEAWDSGMSETLAREAMEESQVRIDDAVYLGFQKVRRPGRAPYAQVRMAGRISGFEPRRPDPDGGRTYRRRRLCPGPAGYRPRRRQPRQDGHPGPGLFSLA
jgi:hypothetical protein